MKKVMKSYVLLHRRKRRKKILAGILAVLLSTVLFASLMLPAAALEEEAICDEEEAAEYTEEDVPEAEEAIEPDEADEEVAGEEAEDSEFDDEAADEEVIEEEIEDSEPDEEADDEEIEDSELDEETELPESVEENFDEEEPDDLEEAWLSARKAPARIASSITSAVITATKKLTGADLTDGQFSFTLTDESTGQVIDTAINDADGNIVFTPITYARDSSGMHEYSIREVDDGQTGITYDDRVYTVQVSVENGNAGVLTFEDHYLGRTLSNQYTIYLRDTETDQSIRVYCIDRAKTQPASENSDIYWIPEVDPDNDTLIKAVCHTTGGSYGAVAFDDWAYTKTGRDLKDNLTRLLYYFQQYPNAFSAAYQATYVWCLTSGIDYVTYNNYKNILNILDASYVPSNYKLVLFHASDGSYQPMAALVPVDTDLGSEQETAVFENEYTKPDIEEKSEPSGTSVTITARKTLDGNAPGDRTFTFQLYAADDMTKPLRTATNDAEGNIVFAPIAYTQAGTYTYVLREVNDGQESIAYDESSYTVTVKISQKDLFDTGGSYYYSVMGGDQAYYISQSANQTDFPVYCINYEAVAPGRSTNTSVTYTPIESPSSSQLSEYVMYNLYQDDLAENLRRLFYVLESRDNWPEEVFDYYPFYNYRTDGDLSVVQKKNIVWAATSNLYGNNYTDVLDIIYRTEIPDSYQLVVFVPNGYVQGSTQSPQPLAGGYGPSVTTTWNAENVTIPVFANTTEESVEYRLPDTGGSGTLPFTIGGLSMIAGTLLYGYVDRRSLKHQLRSKKRKERLT